MGKSGYVGLVKKVKGNYERSSQVRLGWNMKVEWNEVVRWKGSADVLLCAVCLSSESEKGLRW